MSLISGDDTDSSSSSDNDYSDLLGRLKLIRRCDTNIVYVNSIYLTCDSPGSYYYGSGGYRQSSRCKYGDNADMYIFFTISDNYGWYGIDVIIDMGVLAAFTNVEPQTSLCDLGTITYLGSDNSNNNNNNNNNKVYCPTPGAYLLHWSFTMPSGGADQQLQFLPDIRIKFYAQDGNATLGCAGTGTVATVQNAVMHIRQGEMALGIALSAFFLVFGCCLAMAYRRKKQTEEDNKGRQMHQRRYYFARNATTGEIVPVEARGGSPHNATTNAAGGGMDHHQYASYPPSIGTSDQYSATPDQYSYESYDHTTSVAESSEASHWKQQRGRPMQMEEPIVEY